MWATAGRRTNIAKHAKVTLFILMYVCDMSVLNMQQGEGRLVEGGREEERY